LSGTIAETGGSNRRDAQHASASQRRAKQCSKQVSKQYEAVPISIGTAFFYFRAK
jgi:hypothetical protein